MRKVTKTIVIILIIFIGLILRGVNMNARKNSGYVTPGPIGTILFIGIVAAVIAVAKYKPESEQKKDTTADKQTLDKRNPS